ncbi:hypothetical protein CTAYLR_007892 [Chrysophaeum taylorii]|uniref:Uncharacterized protein n=1 Tax=Chrysophaeum taylorii TaxID=2483200 RepID=A0AAD7ULI1_9STRA|nr:hypothetical protein CTAYLR_007892 [Chrysophaeum taylorii]
MASMVDWVHEETRQGTGVHVDSSSSSGRRSGWGLRGARGGHHEAGRGRGSSEVTPASKAKAPPSPTNKHGGDGSEAVELYVCYRREEATAAEMPARMHAQESAEDEALSTGFGQLPNAHSTCASDQRTGSDASTREPSTPSRSPSAALERYVVARSSAEGGSTSSSTTHKLRSAEYACEMLTCAERVDEAVENAVCDRQHSTSASRRADVLAAMAPMKLRRVSERAAAVSRQDPCALVHLLQKDSNETALQDAYDAVSAASALSCQWLSFGPRKRGYAVSFADNPAHHPHHADKARKTQFPFLWSLNSLAMKYEWRLEEAFKACEDALRGLDELRARLPTTARLVRFASRTDVFRRVELSSRHATTISPAQSFHSSIADDEEYCQSKYDADSVDDFLTDAAPLGTGVDSSEIFACRDRDGALFLTSNYRVADDLLRDAAAASPGGDDVEPGSPPPMIEDDDHPVDPDDAVRRHSDTETAALRASLDKVVVERHSTGNKTQQENDHQPAWKTPGPAILATTTIYKSVDDPRKLALDDGDEIWAVAIDDREYYYCVMEDLSDRRRRLVLLAPATVMAAERGDTGSASTQAILAKLFPAVETRVTRPEHFDCWYSPINVFVAGLIAKRNVLFLDATEHQRITNVCGKKKMFYVKRPAASVDEAYKFSPPTQHHVERLLCTERPQVVRFDPDINTDVVPPVQSLMSQVLPSMRCDAVRCGHRRVGSQSASQRALFDTGLLCYSWPRPSPIASCWWYSAADLVDDLLARRGAEGATVDVVSILYAREACRFL